MSFSVLMSVYRNDKPEFLRRAIESVTTEQTLKPSEVILMIDGPISDYLKNVIIKFSEQKPNIKPIWNKENQGLGKVLQKGLLLCSNELVARMDSDDIALPDRFEKQVAFMRDNPDIAVIGGQIAEFIDFPENIVGYRKVPLNSDECISYFQDRDPLNHMTVIFRKSAVMAVGNYQPWHLDEDTYLWGRLIKGGYKLVNLPDILVNVRVGKDMYARRGGWKYFKSDTKILKWKLEQGLTSKGRYLYNYTVRFIVQVLLPNNLRGWIFKNLLRESH